MTAMARASLAPCCTVFREAAGGAKIKKEERGVRMWGGDKEGKERGVMEIRRWGGR